jgi:AraC family transcriptional regulator
MRESDFQLEFSQPVERTRLARPEFAAERIELKGGEHYDFSWKGESNYLALLDLVLERGSIWVDGRLTTPPTDLRDRLIFLPEGSSAVGTNKLAPRNSQMTIVYFDSDFLSRRCNEPQIDAPARLHVVDRGLGDTLHKIERLIEDPSLVDDVLFDALVLLAAVEATRAPGVKPDAPVGGLSAVQKNRMRDFVAANLLREIGLSDLAKIACLSEFHFSRAFQQSFGASPYRYLLVQRVERAKELLRAGDLPLKEVRERTGFKNASQFSRTFRSITGESPRQFQRRG